MRKATSNIRGVTKLSLLAVTGLLGLSLSTTSVSALLQAQSKNDSPHGITAGTLKITQTNNGVGFASTIADMAPGDVVNRYVDYTNTGSLASKTLRLKVSDATPSILTSSETKGLQLVVSDCSGGWTAADGTCSGTKTTLLTSPLATLGSDKNFSGVTALAANSGVLHLQFSVSLPNSTANDETSVNGVLPAGTIQGLSAALTWTLSETQRDAASSNA